MFLKFKYLFIQLHQHTEEPDIIREVFHPYGTEVKTTLDHLEDIQDFADLKYYNKKTPPGDLDTTSKNVNNDAEKKIK